VSQDRRQVEPAKQGERDHVIDDQKLVEAALTLSPGMAPGQQFAHQLTRTQLLQMEDKPCRNRKEGLPLLTTCYDRNQPVELQT
jgi:hypothetical protein